MRGSRCGWRARVRARSNLERSSRLPAAPCRWGAINLCPYTPGRAGPKPAPVGALWACSLARPCERSGRLACRMAREPYSRACRWLTAGADGQTVAQECYLEYSWCHTESPQSHEWVMRRNCALSPQQLGFWFLAIASISLLVAFGMYAAGAWVVLPFACVEILGLGTAFVVYARHATDFERVVVQSEGVVVDRGSSAESPTGIRERCMVPGSWIRVEYGGQRRELVKLVSHRRSVEVGRFVPEHLRPRLAQEFRLALRTPLCARQEA